MTHRILSGIGALILLPTGAALCAAQDVEMHLPAGNYAAQIDTTALADPSGATHTRLEVKGKVVVAIFSAPNMSQGGTQEKWSNLLANQPSTRIVETNLTDQDVTVQRIKAITTKLLAE